MAAQSYGRLLGELILQKRRTKGLTQMQLAEDAFGTPSKTRRIVELEGGQVGRPHPRNIDPIIATLGITEVELEDCARRAGTGTGDATLDRAYREANNLIEAMARQFEHAKPEASLAELEDFLRTRWR